MLLHIYPYRRRMPTERRSEHTAQRPTGAGGEEQLAGFERAWGGRGAGMWTNHLDGHLHARFRCPPRQLSGKGLIARGQPVNGRPYGRQSVQLGTEVSRPAGDYDFGVDKTEQGVGEATGGAW